MVDYNAELYKQQVHCYITLGELDNAQASLTAAENIFMSLPEPLGTEWQLIVIKLAADAHAKNNVRKAFQLSQKYYEKLKQLRVKNLSTRLSSEVLLYKLSENILNKRLLNNKKNIALDNESMTQQ